jgi:hypothetical protein
MPSWTGKSSPTLAPTTPALESAAVQNWIFREQTCARGVPRPTPRRYVPLAFFVSARGHFRAVARKDVWVTSIIHRSRGRIIAPLGAQLGGIGDIAPGQQDDGGGEHHG